MDETFARSNVRSLLEDKGAIRLADKHSREVWLLEDYVTLIQFAEGDGRIPLYQLEDIFHLLGLSHFDLDYFIG